MMSAYFCEFLANNVATSGTVVYFISAGLEAETADARACEGSEQYAPYPCSCSHFAVHPRHADVVALGASHFYWIARCTGVRRVPAAILALSLSLSRLGQFLRGRSVLFRISGDDRSFSESSIGVVDAGEGHLIYYS